MRRNLYRTEIIDNDGSNRWICGECEKSGTEATKENIRAWCEKWGHTFLEDTYRELEIEDNPAATEAMLNDIRGDRSEYD